MAMTLIQTTKLNGVDPQAWLTDVLERIVSGRTKSTELDALLPWNWRPDADLPIAAAARSTTPGRQNGCSPGCRRHCQCPPA
ncbi:transposase domain-containing protein [Dankookia rubra]|uniref:Transposase domain-containing protein n=1 Tax=Dankookia rubra TaxID=1442381 RepID=A0A4R5QCD3_9PROT|nr:transposase domain-containing protein [Dankookia rubra]